MSFHIQSVETAIQAMKVQPDTGLSQAEADIRLTAYGPNELIEKGGRSTLRIFWEQLTTTMVIVLITAAVVTGLLGDLKNTIAISAIVILYAVLGFIQEYRAEKAIAGLKKLSVRIWLPQRWGSAL